MMQGPFNTIRASGLSKYTLSTYDDKLLATGGFFFWPSLPVRFYSVQALSQDSLIQNLSHHIGLYSPCPSGYPLKLLFLHILLGGFFWTSHL